ncbi:MAG: hypothetical protein ACTTKI_00320 [Tannerella sp.]|uniref:hypothetical protein n=1 Tax=Tannerella sp. TaxID=2382127 RepID=UPI003FA2B75C
MPRIRDLQQYTGALNRVDIFFVVDGQSFARGQKLSGQQVYTMCKGEDGKNIEIRAFGGYLQWRQEGAPSWTNLVALNDLKGADGKNVELRKHQNYIQSRPAGGEWVNLVALSELKGDKGERGLQGKPLTVLPNGHYGQWDEVQGKYVDSGVEAAATVDINNVNVTFTEAAERKQVETGESVPTLFGKIRKWFSDLKALAFKDKVDYNTDVENTPQLGALAGKSRVDYNTEVDNTPALGALAKKNSVDYNTEVDNRPSLITLENVQSEVSTHNQAGNAHTDIRGLITALTASALTAARVKQGSGIQVETQGNGDVKISCTIDNDLFVVVQSLPPSGIANRLYLVPKPSPAGQNIHDEYLYINGKWEQVGTVAVDLGNYYTKGEANNKINELIATHNSSDEAHAGMFVSVPQQTITTAMWTASGGRFKCSVNVAGMKATSVGWWTPAHDSEEECASAGVLSLVQTFAGRYELYAKKKPTKNIIVHVFYKK